MTLQQTIVDRYSDLTPELQRAADYVLQHPQQLVTSSMRTFARQGTVQPATLLRLAKKLNYAGWSELKSALIAELGLVSEDYGSRALKLAESGAPAIRDEMFQSQQANLARAQQLNENSLSEAVDLLEAADNIYICGFRASFPLAYSLYYVYRLFRTSVWLIDGHAGNIELYTRALASKDALLVAGFAPYSKEGVGVFEAARGAGCKIVSLTDNPLSPLSVAADVVLQFPTDSPSFFPSILSGMAIGESLMAMLMARHGAPAVSSIASAERHLIATGAYVMPGKKPA